jgi:ABC-type spermidine/putrescine transport system permease subunit II
MSNISYARKRPAGFWGLLAVFTAFVLFLYGPMITIFILSFQGPEGGLTFPLRGISLHWFYKLAEGLGVVDIGAAFKRSLFLGSVVMALTMLMSVLAGLAFRKNSVAAMPFLCHCSQSHHAIHHRVSGHWSSISLDGHWYQIFS